MRIDMGIWDQKLEIFMSPSLPGYKIIAASHRILHNS